MKNNNHTTSHHFLRGIKNFFSQEPLWKLFSLAVAVFMWFIVMNVINPTEVKNFTATVSFDNMDALTSQGYIISNLKEIEKTSVNVKIEGTRPALDELSKSEYKNNIKARIDLSKIEVSDTTEFPKTYSVVIVPSLPSGLYIYNYDIANYYPTVCQVEIDKSASKTVPVQLKTYGEPATGYVAGNPKSSITEIEITGPESRIANVERAVATIDISGAKERVIKNCALVVYDEDDLPLEGFISEPAEISASVEIRKNNTIKIEEPITLGSLPDTLELISIEWSPKTIDVTSLGESAVESITLPVINLSEITKDTTEVVDISDNLEKAGLEAVGNNTSVTMTIRVGLKSGEKYTINPDMIGITGLSSEFDVEIADSVSFEVGGVESLDVNSFMPSIDLSGLSEGEYSVPVHIVLPENAIVNEAINIDVVITRKNVTTESVTENTDVTGDLEIPNTTENHTENNSETTTNIY